MEHLLDTLVEWAKSAGPFGTLLCLYLFLRESKERKDTYKSWIDSIKAMEQQNYAMLKLSSLLEMALKKEQK